MARLADLALIPTRPAILDLRAVGGTVAVVKATRTAAAFVLNGCPPARGIRASTLVTEARQALAGLGLPVAAVAVTHRAAMGHALIGGEAPCRR